MTSPDRIEVTDWESFIDWAKSVGCSAEVWQEDDGSGYACLYLTTPELLRFDISVTELGQ